VNTFALLLVVFVFLVLFYGIIIIHDIPYELAKRRQHPHQDAIHAAGWISLFTLHVIWPFLWIWSMMYNPKQGWGMSASDKTQSELLEHISALQLRVEKLEKDKG